MAFVSFILFLALVAAAALTGVQFRPGLWYDGLIKPDWTPPKWLFPPVWTALYIMIAIAGWRVYEREGFGATLAVWFVALALNAVWSWIMFGQHQIALAALDIVALWIAVVAFIILAWNVDRLASLLFVPYLVWITYAAALNLAILRSN
jgi:tryptophan-rich sensory protein